MKAQRHEPAGTAPAERHRTKKEISHA